jgi:hypothetical protein
MKAEGRGEFEVLCSTILSHAGAIEVPLKRDLTYLLVEVAFNHLAPVIRDLPVRPESKSLQILKDMLTTAFPERAATNEQLMGLGILAGMERTLDIYGPKWMTRLCGPCLVIIDESKKAEPRTSGIGNAIIDIFASTVVIDAKPKDKGHYLHSAWEMAQSMKIMEAKNRGLRAIADAIYAAEQRGAEQRAKKEKK